MTPCRQYSFSVVPFRPRSAVRPLVAALVPRFCLASKRLQFPIDEIAQTASELFAVKCRDNPRNAAFSGFAALPRPFGLVFVQNCSHRFDRHEGRLKGVDAARLPNALEANSGDSIGTIPIATRFFPRLPNFQNGYLGGQLSLKLSLRDQAAEIGVRLHIAILNFRSTVRRLIPETTIPPRTNETIVRARAPDFDGRFVHKLEFDEPVSHDLEPSLIRLGFANFALVPR